MKEENELHPDSLNLLKQSFEELKAKMIRNQDKYGYSNEWLTSDWEDECREHMMQHIRKGDPKDVAIYAMFMMYRGWSTDGLHTESLEKKLNQAIEERHKLSVAFANTLVDKIELKKKVEELEHIISISQYDAWTEANQHCMKLDAKIADLEKENQCLRKALEKISEFSDPMGWAKEALKGDFKS